MKEHVWEEPDLSTCELCGHKDWMADGPCSGVAKVATPRKAPTLPMTPPELRYKEGLEARLVAAYGENYKTPLAAKLCVDVSTIRRQFNRPKPIENIYAQAIENQLATDGRPSEPPTANSIRDVNLESDENEWKQ